MPGDGRRGQRVRRCAGDAEAAGEALRWAVGVLRVSTERRQAAQRLVATVRAVQRRLARDHAGAAGLAVPLQEQRTGTFRGQLLLHPSHLEKDKHQTPHQHPRTDQSLII